MERIIFTALFSCCLSGLMSGWVTFINLGVTDTFLSDWSMAFIKAYSMAFLAAYGLAKPIKLLTQKIIGSNS
ncbi:DUF2798 domain-containing protein [Alteromonas lipotrueae]|uniref:DUF2798 domain-containing protein n=1 Tax=Alteromonas lipotrueae TaxID=2803814 RepID=UPI001C4469C2|nr:DUF2798 domain-containing protein [Alteromonas lipotrueae]